MAEDILDPAPDANFHKPKENSAGHETPNGTRNHAHYAADPEAQDMVIESLRSQIQDLFSQVTQLNSKLVKSYDRVSDLEDDLHVASAHLRTSSVKISQLELERTQHLAALNTGLLVEKDHVTAELNRLMEKATEEAAQRGQAESAQAAIEKELDDLSASLFNQANNMVAEARYAQHISKRKAEDAEQALRGAEEAVSAMQQQVQTLQEEKDVAEKKTGEIQSLMGKGKWIEGRDSQLPGPTLRLYRSHLPYQEFLLFVAHLRHLHLGSPNPPVMSTLLPLPFLTRLSTEDSEPSTRLDLAPSLNWLSRRSVLAAIHNGQLTIEPMSFNALLMESSNLSNAGISGSGNNDYIPCALCGTSIYPQVPSMNTSLNRSPAHPLTGIAHSYSGSGSSWSTNLFKKSSISLNSTTSGPLSVTPHSNKRTTQSISNPVYPSQVYIFRISTNQISSLPQLPLLKSSTSATPSGASTPSTSYQNTPSILHSSGGSGTPSQSSSTIYPLCLNGWCLARLRTTCSMWAFVRTNIVERIWEEELPPAPPPPVPNRTTTSTAVSVNPSNSATRSGATEKPALPPRKRGLWGLATAIGERAASWSESASDKEKARRASATPTSEKENRTLPPAPPHHPQERPDIPASEPAVPPPLPKRSEGRARTPNPPPSPARPSTDSASVPATEVASAVDQSESKASSNLEATATKDEPITSVADLRTSASEPASVAAAALSTPPQTPTRAQVTSSPATPAPPIPPRAVKRLSASLVRSSTPSNVPLPDSRPGTPVTASASPNPPSRTSSPALGSPPASGAPPPIPRRAAARVPRKPVGESRDSSQPSSPAVPASLAKGDDGQAQGQSASLPQSQLDSVNETVEESKEKQVKESEERDGPPRVPEAPKAIELAPSTHSTVSAFTEAEEFVDAEEGAENKEEDEEEEADVETVKEGKETKEAPEAEADNGDLAEETKQEVMGSPEQEDQPVISLTDQDLPQATATNAPSVPPPPVPSRRSEYAQLNGVNGSKAEEPENDEDEEQMYIAGTTWEEKTWKELTRLREELFYARIGVVRS